jgi:DNA-binding transcriptional MerR regulator
MDDFQKAFTIKEFSELTGIPQNTLRNWEEKLENAFLVPRDPHSNRYYTDRHIKIVDLIQKWRNTEYEFTFAQIKEMLLRLQDEERLANFQSPVDGGEGSHSVVALSQSNSGAPISMGSGQIQQMQHMINSMEERMQEFFNKMDTVLQKHSDSTQIFIKNEIETLKNEQIDKDEQLIQKIEDNFRQKIDEESSLIDKNVSSIKEELKNNLEQSRNEIQVHMESFLDKSKNEFQKQIEDSISKWAVISKDEISGLQKSKKKGLWGLFGKKD